MDENRPTNWSDETIDDARAKLTRMRLAMFDMHDAIRAMSASEYDTFTRNLHRRWIVECGPALLRLWAEAVPAGQVLLMAFPDPTTMFRQLASEQ